MQKIYAYLAKNIEKANKMQKLPQNKDMNKSRKKILAFLIFAALTALPCADCVFKAFADCELPLSLKVQTEAGEYEFFYPQIQIGENGTELLGKEDIVNAIYLDNYVAPVNAEVIFKPDAEPVFSFKKEKSGKVLEPREIKSALEYALSCGKNQISLHGKIIQPQITVNDLKKNCVLRASFSTLYSTSPAERKHNVELAASAVSGCVLLKGESFSFNAVVGERSEARGYKKAKVISGGEYTLGVGGGVCQVSTTIYNAALKAGLEIIECHKHSLPVSYVEPSFDAMVNSGSSDLIIKNDTENAIYIAVYADGEKITADIYGEKNEYEYKLISKVTEKIRAQTTVEYDENLPAGVKTEIAKALDGLKSEGYISAFKNGRLVFTKKIRSDVYAPRAGVIKIGGKGA